VEVGLRQHRPMTRVQMAIFRITIITVQNGLVLRINLIKGCAT